MTQSFEIISNYYKSCVYVCMYVYIYIYMKRTKFRRFICQLDLPV